MVVADDLRAMQALFRTALLSAWLRAEAPYLRPFVRPFVRTFAGASVIAPFTTDIICCVSTASAASYGHRNCWCRGAHSQRTLSPNSACLLVRRLCSACKCPGMLVRRVLEPEAEPDDAGGHRGGGRILAGAESQPTGAVVALL